MQLSESVRRWFLASALVILLLAGQLNIASSPGRPHSANKNELSAIATTEYPVVIRDGYAAAGDAPPLMYVASGSACSLGAGVGDGGSQVQSANGKCWLAVFPETGPSVSQFGAKHDGSTDATAALNACLAAAGTIGKGTPCLIDAGARLQVLGDVMIPAHSGVACQNATINNAEGSPFDLDYNTMAAILLDQAHSIIGAGIGVAVTNCLILANGVVWPAADSKGYSGTAIDFSGVGSGCTILNTEILGFDTAINAFNCLKPRIRDVYLDGTGVTNAVLYIGVGGDTGSIDGVKVQPIGTGNGDCTKSLRPGTGVLISGGTGGPFIGTMIAQNFERANFDFESSAPQAQLIWSDWLSDCPRGASIGVKINNATGIIINQLGLSGSNTGLRIIGGSVNASNSFGDIYCISIAQDCVALGDVGNAAGVAILHSLRVAPFANMVGRYIVNYLDTTNNSTIEVDSGVFINANGGAAPYFNIPSSVPTYRISLPDAPVTDLARPSTLYGTTSLSSCTGIGAQVHARCNRRPAATRLKGGSHYRQVELRLQLAQ